MTISMWSTESTLSWVSFSQINSSCYICGSVSTFFNTSIGFEFNSKTVLFVNAFETMKSQGCCIFTNLALTSFDNSNSCSSNNFSCSYLDVLLNFQSIAASHIILYNQRYMDPSMKVKYIIPNDMSRQEIPQNQLFTQFLSLFAAWKTQNMGCFGSIYTTWLC